MELTIVIGNGETRKEFDLNKLNDHITFGCNALARNWNPTYICAADRAMVEELADLSKIVYTRPEWKKHFHRYSCVKYFPDLPDMGDKKQDQPMQWGSGMYAAYLACLSGPSTIYLMGYDLYSPGGEHNNIYKGTINYKEDHARPVNPSFWIYQLNKLHEIHPEIEFTYILPDDWPFPPEWTSNNVSRINYQSFSKIA